MEKLKPSYLVSGEKSLAVPQNRTTIWPSNSTAKYTPQRTENKCSNIKLCINICGSTIHYHQNVTTTQISMILRYIHAMEYYSAKTTLNKGSQMQKATSCIIPIIRNFQNRQVHGNRKKQEELDSTCWWIWGFLVGSGGDRNVLKLNSSDGCTSRWIYF